MEDTQIYNHTLNDFVLESNGTISTYETVSLIWRTVCMIANCVILCIILKNSLLRSSNIYFTLFHWSICNLVYILSLLYLAVIPEDYITLECLEVSYFLHDIITSLFVIIATMFIYNAYINSKNFCKFSIYAFWTLYLLLIIVMTLMVHFKLTNNNIWLYLLGVTKIVCFSTLLVELVLFFNKLTQTKSNIVRFIISSIYIVCNFTDWILNILISQNIYDVVSFEIISMVCYGNGLINLILLIRYDSNFKDSFRNMFKRCTCSKV